MSNSWVRDGVGMVGGKALRRRSGSTGARRRPCRRAAGPASAALLRCGHVLQDPGELGGREQRVDAKAGGCDHRGVMALLRSARRRRRRCGGIARSAAGQIGCAGRGVPDHERLALVGDGDGVGSAPASATIAAMTWLHRGPDVLRPIARPSRGADSRWSAGREARARTWPACIDQQRLGVGGALVDGEDAHGSGLLAGR